VRAARSAKVFFSRFVTIAPPNEALSHDTNIMIAQLMGFPSSMWCTLPDFGYVIVIAFLSVVSVVSSSQSEQELAFVMNPNITSSRRFDIPNHRLQPYYVASEMFHTILIVCSCQY